MYMASNIDIWLPESGKPNLKMIVSVVFAMNVLSTIQDVVVDGWSLTMLKRFVVLLFLILSITGKILGLCNDKFDKTFNALNILLNWVYRYYL